MRKFLFVGILVAAPALAQIKAGDAQAGRQLYMKNGCYQCHGQSGQGGLSGARLAQTKLTAAAFTAYVRNPAPGGMPPYRAAVMSDQELADVYAYIAALPAPPPVQSIPILNDDAAGSREPKAEIENDRVRVWRLKQAPHEKTAMREHFDAVIVYLTDAHQKVADANGKSLDLAKQSGDVAYLAAGNNSIENVSDASVNAVVVELKPSSRKNHAFPVALDPVKLDPEHHLVPLENERVRVLHTILVPHLKSPRHDHPAYVVVYLTDLHTTMTLADGKKVDNPRRPGEIAFREAYQHISENIGDHTAEEIQVELKYE